MKLEIPLRTWLALFGLGLALFVAVPLLPVVGRVLMLFFFTALLALLINPLAVRLERYGIARGVTVSGVLAIVAGIVGLLVFQVVPILLSSIVALARRIERLAPELGIDLSALPLLNVMSDEGRSLLGQAASMLEWAAGAAGNLAGQIGAAFFLIFVVVVMVFTLVGNPQTTHALLHAIVPPRHHERVITLTHSVSIGLARWFVAQMAISTYYIVAYAVVNTLLGVPFATPIAIISGLLEFIPYLGGIVGLALSVLAAATVSWETVLWVVITNVIIGSICVYLVSPFFYSRAINVPVAAVLLGLFIGGQIGGFLAALLTVPAVTIIVILIRELKLFPNVTAPQPADSAPAAETLAPAPSTPAGQPRVKQ